MAEKRMSTRFRGERPPKRQLSPSPPPQTHRKLKQKSPSPVEQEKKPSKSSQERKGLPTLNEPQPTNLEPTMYQSIAESGILAMSVGQSRQKWLFDGVFEKFWTKPSKKKGLPDPQNPARESMSKLGVCSMFIEPHVFEITLHSIRSPSVLPAPSQYYSQSPRPIVPPLQPVSTPQRSPRPPIAASGGLSPSSDPFARVPQESEPVQAPSRDQFQRRGSESTPSSIPKDLHHATASVRGAGEPMINGKGRRDSSTSTDPVIQMLAARASTDHELKSLMKVVAQGNASPSELRTFQKHIDELHAIISSQNEASRERPATNPTTASKPAEIPRPPSKEGGGVNRPLQPAGPPPIAVKLESPAHFYAHSPLQAKSKISSGSKPEVTAIAFDINGGTGDRYLIPKDSVVEYTAGNTQALVSFLVLRKGSEAASGKYQPDTTYHQMVTMRLSCHHPKVIEHLGRVVAPAEEARRKMANAMHQTTPASGVYLATRAPRSAESEHQGNEGVGNEARNVDDIPMDNYEAPNSLLPMSLPVEIGS